VLVDSVASSTAHVRAGKLKALATTSPRRLSVLPDLPTVAESGYPGFQSTAWVGLLAPAGTPRPVIERLHAAVIEVMALTETRERMAAFGAEISTSSPEEFGAHIRSEMARLGKVVRDANIKVN
jgi:tripartite-type tricarboxylate transporter receptor subunit TctC